MTIRDGDVALLARQAVDLLDPTLEIDIDPGPQDDPYRFGPRSWTVWPLLGGRRSAGIRLVASMTRVEALATLIEELGAAARTPGPDGPAVPAYAAFPPCPGHEHAALVGADVDVVTLTCPDTQGEVARLTPDVPA